MSSATQRRGMRRRLRRSFVLSLPPLIIVITLVFWQALSRQEQGNIAQGIELSAGYIRDEIVQTLETDTRALGRMGRRWEVAGKPLQAIWEADAAQYIRDTPDYQAIEWIDPSLHIRWLVPLQGNEKALNPDLVGEGRRATALLTARDSRQTTISRSINLVQGGKGFLVYVPIYRQNHFEGLIAGVFRFSTILKTLLHRSEQGYTLALLEDEQEIYTTGTPASDMTAWSRQVPFDVRGRHWVLQVTPEPSVIAKYRSPMPGLLLATGLLTSLLTALTIAVQRKAAAAHARAMEEAAKRIESEARLAEAQQVAHLGNFSFDIATKEIFWTEEAYRQFDCDPALGMPDYETVIGLLHPKDLERLTALRIQACEDRHPFACDVRIRQQEGTFRWSHMRAKVEFDSMDRPCRIVGTTQDIHERKCAEEGLRQSEARFRAATDGSLDAFFLLDAVRNAQGDIEDFVFTDLNQRGEWLIKLPREQILGQRLCELIPINRTGGFLEKFIQVVNSQQTLEEEFSIASEQIDALWLHHQVVPLGNSIAITTRDITARKQAEQSLLEKQKFIEGIAHASPDILYLYDLIKQ